ncbi:hypothetical protein TNCV_1916381 [Trichonephila clavipes]|uniref:Secreted protein n=1 Tax=Trichonephila clavipes TaxID=2585209 RepID=A0A8X6W0H5_TRICX|nr:hypothetical protein TNCV_1916381 [Trichonephila clavipes]
MTPVEDPAIVFASAQLILLYLGTAAVAFPAHVQTCSIGERSGALAGHVCHTPSCPRSAKIQSTLPMMWGQCDVVGAEVATLLIARSSRSFVFLGRPDPPRRYTLPSEIHCCQHRATTISLRPRWRPIRLFDQPASLRPIIRPYQSPSAARTAAGYVLEAS